MLLIVIVLMLKVKAGLEEAFFDMGCVYNWNREQKSVYGAEDDSRRPPSPRSVICLYCIVVDPGCFCDWHHGGFQCG